jgi:hypothetical protein
MYKSLIAACGLMLGSVSAAHAHIVVKVGIIHSLFGFLAARGDEMQKRVDVYAKACKILNAPMP